MNSRMTVEEFEERQRRKQEVFYILYSASATDQERTMAVEFVNSFRKDPGLSWWDYREQKLMELKEKKS